MRTIMEEIFFQDVLKSIIINMSSVTLDELLYTDAVIQLDSSSRQFLFALKLVFGSSE